MLHSRWAKVRDHVIDALALSGDTDLDKRAARLEECCSHPQIHVDQHGKPMLCLQSCRDRLCPRCQCDRGRAATLRITALCQTMNAPRFITLTLKHRNASLLQELDRAADAFRILRRDPVWRRHVSGGVYAIQVTKNPQTSRWHVHFHMLVDGSFFPQKLLSDLWLKCTGDSPVVDIQSVADRAATAKYISSYVTKPNALDSWDHASICQYATAMHGRRTLHTFGTMHGRPVDPPAEATERKSADSLGSIARFQRFADRGHERAGHALEVLSRMGPTWRAAVGRPPLLFNAPAEPVLDWEIALVVNVGRELQQTDEATWTTDEASPEERPRPPDQQQRPLFNEADDGQRPNVYAR